MNPYKVIVMDVDGTLTNKEKKITQKTKAALKMAQEQGMILVLASGRPTSGLLNLAKELEMDQHQGLLVSYNGSQVIDLSTKAILLNNPLSISEAKSILRHLKQFNL
ncbi:HAD-IIB family hydrolase, partial [Turicibacter sanguinis]|nr:HAD-IIB family hydrolase [Turicibacter sanguinis]